MFYKEQCPPSTVFRAYDIRGIINEEFNENAFYTIGRAISCHLLTLNRHKIFLGRDGRLSSEKLAEALKQGLLASGITVIDLGPVPTPVLYYATYEHGVDCGLMVTGSHNPKDYNGIKMVLAGKPLGHIDKLYYFAKRGEFINGQGENFIKNDILADYYQRIATSIRLLRPMKVVLDCGNGIAGLIAPRVFQALGCEIIPLYCDVDGRFPHHHPDPSVEANLADLIASVKHHHADVGFAFDGDMDRLGVVTNQGTIIWPDRLMMFYAQNLLKIFPGATIVYDVKCSAHLNKVIEMLGGIAEMCPTGHAIVKEVMKKSNAILAGEMSGHIFFNDRWYGFDDALYSACRLLEILSQNEVSIEEQFALIPTSFNTPEIKISINEEEKFSFMRDFCKKAEFPAKNVIRIDGLRVEFEHGWGLIRASNTTPCLVARFEAQDAKSLADIQTLFKKELLRVNEKLAVPF